MHQSMASQLLGLHNFTMATAISAADLVTLPDLALCGRRVYLGQKYLVWTRQTFILCGWILDFSESWTPVH
jgi:hypothetical protein